MSTSLPAWMSRAISSTAVSKIRAISKRLGELYLSLAVLTLYTVAACHLKPRLAILSAS